MEPDIRTPPSAIAADEKKLAAWNSATDDERMLIAALYGLESDLCDTEIDRYLRFAQWWHVRYPKGNKVHYTRGMSAVKNGAALSPYSEQHVYAVLRTGRVYTLEAYQELKMRALENGIHLKWTCLKTLATKLGKPQYNKIRHAVEREMTKSRLTEKQMLKLIASYAPEVVAEKETAEESPKPTKVLRSFVSTMKRNVDKCNGLQETIVHLDRTIEEDDAEEVKAELREVLDMFDLMARFIEENRPRLEQSLKSVSIATESEDEKEETVRRVAESINKRIQAGKQQPAPQRNQRLTLAPGFNDEDEEMFDRSPRMTFRDDGDENEFGSLDDQFDDDPDEWDDPDDEEDPVFDEIGNIPALPPRGGTRR